MCHVGGVSGAEITRVLPRKATDSLTETHPLTATRRCRVTHVKCKERAATGASHLLSDGQVWQRNTMITQAQADMRRRMTPGDPPLRALVASLSNVLLPLPYALRPCRLLHPVRQHSAEYRSQVQCGASHIHPILHEARERHSPRRRPHKPIQRAGDCKWALSCRILVHTRRQLH